MMDALAALLILFLGLAGGVAVGSGLVAFLVVLDVIPRLAQIAVSQHRGAQLEVAVVLGAVTWTWLDLMGWSFTFTPWLTSFVGLLMGAFVGTVAAALAEVLNVFPILTRRLHMERVLSWLIAAVLLGKVFGSLFEWLVFRT